MQSYTRAPTVRCQYKYLLLLDGNTVSGRGAALFKSGSVGMHINAHTLALYIHSLAQCSWSFFFRLTDLHTPDMVQLSLIAFVSLQAIFDIL